MPLFNRCEFYKSLSFENVKLKSPLFNNINTDGLNISKLEIINCEIDEKFILNKLKANYLLIKDSEFKSKVELKEGMIDKVELINTNFNGLFDSYATKYGSFYCFKNIFSDFVGFEQCKFSSLPDKIELNEIAIFKYVTFLSFTNFRNSTFSEGLDLENTNLEETPNFLNINLLSNKTNRETLRIIKNSFDKIGNHIEANKFFVLEMRKYKEELNNKPISPEKIIFWLNEKISNFGQSYIFPICWIFGCAVIYSLLVLGYENNILYKILPSANGIIRCISDFMNNIASNIVPFKKFLKEGMEFVSLVFYIIFSSLMWQTIIAIKRHTPR